MALQLDCAPPQQHLPSPRCAGGGLLQQRITPQCAALLLSAAAESRLMPAQMEGTQQANDTQRGSQQQQAAGDPAALPPTGDGDAHASMAAAAAAEAAQLQQLQGGAASTAATPADQPPANAGCTAQHASAQQAAVQLQPLQQAPAPLLPQQQQQQQQQQGLQQEHAAQQQLLLQQQHQQQQQQQVHALWKRAGHHLWRAVDSVRLPLLHVHTRMEAACSGSQHVMAAALGVPVSSCSSASVDQCWIQLQASSRALQEQQQQQQHAAGQACELAPASPGQQGEQQQPQQQQPQSGRSRWQPQQQQQEQRGRRSSATRAGEAAAAPAPRPSTARAAGAARPPMPKPPRRPWQPKMQPDEPNWNQAAFFASESRAAAAALPARHGSKALQSPTEFGTARVAVLMMLHGTGCPNHLLWERWQAAHAPGSIALLVHMKAGVSVTPDMPGVDLINRNRLSVSVNSCWGDVSLVQAQLDGMAEVLQRCPAATHIALASGHDIPLQLIQPGLLPPGVSLFGAYQFGEPEARTLKVAAVDELVSAASLTEEEAQAWGRALIFHHQWMVLAREHAAALVALRREILLVGRVIHRACNSVQAGMAPDEFILITALRAHGYVRSITRVEVKPGMRFPPGCLLNSYPTLVLFPAESSPHPVLWTDLHGKVSCQVEKHTGQQYSKLLSLAECLGLAQERCALFFRKVQVAPSLMETLATTLDGVWAGRRGGSASGGSTKRGSKEQPEDRGGLLSDAAAGATEGDETDSGRSQRQRKKARRSR